MQIGAPGYAANAGLVLLYSAATDPQVPTFLVPSAAQAAIGFGSAVSLSSAFLAVGTTNGFVFVYGCIFAWPAQPSCTLDSTYNAFNTAVGAQSLQHGSVLVTNSLLFYVCGGMRLLP